MKKTIIILFLFLFISYQSCTTEETAKDIEYQLPSTFQSTNKIRYTVDGGGDIDFIVENNTDSLSLVVLRYQFQIRNDSLMLSKMEIDSLNLVTIEAMFQGAIDIGGKIYKNDFPTGSWTYLYIENNNDWLRVANGAIIAELSSFYQLVYINMN